MRSTSLVVSIPVVIGLLGVSAAGGLLTAGRLGYVADYRRGAVTCSVHGTPLYPAVAPIEYGLLTIPAYGAAVGSNKAFPHAGVHISGGCVVGKARWAIVDRCHRCAAARREWLRAQGEPRVTPYTGVAARR